MIMARLLSYTISAFFIFLLVWDTQAKNLEPMSLVVELPGAVGLSTKKLAMKEAIRQASEEKIKAFIGVVNYENKKQLIEQKILTHSNKYIPYIQIVKSREIALETSPQQIGEDEQPLTQVQYLIELKLSIQDLKGLLQQERILGNSSIVSVLLPMITLYDESSLLAYSWWKKSKTKSGDPTFHLQKSMLNFNSYLYTELAKRGFFTIRPIRNQDNKLIQETYTSHKLTSFEYSRLSKQFKS